MPAKGLLRDGLLVLEADHPLDEAECTLLLRAALFYGRGMITALQHQTDPERTAGVMTDMLLHAHHPLNPAQLAQVGQQDPGSGQWLAPLLRLLQQEATVALEPRRTLAEAALIYLSAPPQSRPPANWLPVSEYPHGYSVGPKPRRASGRLSRHLPRVLMLLAVVLLIVAAILFWQDRRGDLVLNTSMQRIPAGVYVISDDSLPNADRLVQLQAFAIDHTEVTNEAYRRCYDDSICSWPERRASINRPDYFFNPALGGYPMINVTWTQAEIYCTWAGKRLPLLEEWEVAAGSALTLRKRFIFPWGDSFNANVVNSALHPEGDPVPVATFSPAGDSPAGVADMAGNVAEWTATPSDVSIEIPRDYVVKGGSFLSAPEDLLVAARQTVDATRSAPWLGFRCAATLPTP